MISGCGKQWGFCPLGKMEGCRKHQCPLKEPTHKLTHLQVLTLGTGEGTVTQGAAVSYKGQTEMCGIRARAGGLSPFSLSPVQPAGRCHLSCVESSPTGLNLYLVGLVSSTYSNLLTH